MNYGINHFSEHPFRTSEQTTGFSEPQNFRTIINLSTFNLNGYEFQQTHWRLR